MPQLPLLIFPNSIKSTPKRKNGGPDKIILPSKDIQVERIEHKILDGINKFNNPDNFLINNEIDLEQVYVIEIAGTVEDFKKVLDETIGIEWLFEWDTNIESDEYFYDEKDTHKKLNGRIFLSMNNQQGLTEILSLWNMWKENILPRGKSKWRDVFERIKDIRTWGVKEQLDDTGIREEWIKELEEENVEPIRFEIELFYRRNSHKRRKNEDILRTIVEDLEGSLISSFLDIPDINFHAVKVELPRGRIREIIQKVDEGIIDSSLLKFSNLMYVRPTGQALSTVTVEDESLEINLQGVSHVEGEPIIAILDGVPLAQHELLSDRILVDDPDDYASEYQPGEMKHGTAMSSLVIYGELDAEEEPLIRPVYFHPIMQVNAEARGFGMVEEHVPDNVFLEDKIYRAVRRMFEGEGDVPAQAKYIKVINLSIGDPSRPFNGIVSPLARLIDFLAWKYKVLFCISAGNIRHDYDFQLTENEYNVLNENEKAELLLNYIKDSAHDRKILSPAESINALTVGSIHDDTSGTWIPRNRIDIQPFNFALPSTVNRLGLGFRDTIKPEIFFAGGRQLYTPSIIGREPFKINDFTIAPGQKVAVDSNNGGLNNTVYTRGTSNATALATRLGAKIFEVVNEMKNQNPDKIEDSQIAIIIKALLTHGASKKDWKNIYEEYLRNGQNLSIFKKEVSKFIGYGEVNANKVLACTEQQATIIGAGKITEKECREYRIPLPPSLSDDNSWRRLTITLAWFTPINSNHRKLRTAELFFTPPHKNASLGLERQESEYHQVKRSTVQHEILESEKVSHYEDGDNLVILVQCHADAIANLDDEIDYALIVTLETKDDVLLPLPIYEEIKTRIQTQIQV